MHIGIHMYMYMHMLTGNRSLRAGRNTHNNIDYITTYLYHQIT